MNKQIFTAEELSDILAGLIVQGRFGSPVRDPNKVSTTISNVEPIKFKQPNELAMMIKDKAGEIGDIVKVPIYVTNLKDTTYVTDIGICGFVADIRFNPSELEYVGLEYGEWQGEIEEFYDIHTIKEHGIYFQSLLDIEEGNDIEDKILFYVNIKVLATITRKELPLTFNGMETRLLRRQGTKAMKIMLKKGNQLLEITKGNGKVVVGKLPEKVVGGEVELGNEGVLIDEGTEISVDIDNIFIGDYYGRDLENDYYLKFVIYENGIQVGEISGKLVSLGGGYYSFSGSTTLGGLGGGGGYSNLSYGMYFEDKNDEENEHDFYVLIEDGGLRIRITTSKDGKPHNRVGYYKYTMSNYVGEILKMKLLVNTYKVIERNAVQGYMKYREEGQQTEKYKYIIKSMTQDYIKHKISQDMLYKYIEEIVTGVLNKEQLIVPYREVEKFIERVQVMVMEKHSNTQDMYRKYLEENGINTISKEVFDYIYSEIEKRIEGVVVKDISKEKISENETDNGLEATETRVIFKFRLE